MQRSRPALQYNYSPPASSVIGTMEIPDVFLKTGFTWAHAMAHLAYDEPKEVITMSIWPRYPTLYEINTWVWLSELSLKTGTAVDLGSVPSAEWDAIAKFGFDAVWFMGVWERSPAGIAIANQNQNLVDDFRRALPDFKPEDNVGSPYCIRRYVVDKHLGGPEGLAIARRELAQRGMKLLLDFVPNHVAPDHPWVIEHPEYFIRGNTDDARNDSGILH